MALIARIHKGGDRTLLEAAVANELVDPINAMMNVQITPAGVATWKRGKDGFVLDFALLDARLKTLEAKAAANNSKLQLVKNTLEGA